MFSFNYLAKQKIDFEKTIYWFLLDENKLLRIGLMNKAKYNERPTEVYIQVLRREEASDP